MDFSIVVLILGSQSYSEKGEVLPNSVAVNRCDLLRTELFVSYFQKPHGHLVDILHFHLDLLFMNTTCNVLPDLRNNLLLFYNYYCSDDHQYLFFKIYVTFNSLHSPFPEITPFINLL